MQMKNKKQKGYVLAIVIVLTFILTLTVTSTFTIIMRYMTYAKSHLNKINTAYYEVIQEEVINV